MRPGLPSACLLAAAFLLPAAREAAGQGQWIDLGAPNTVEVAFAFDPLTLVRIPPGAFGERARGTLAHVLIDAPSCNGPECVSGQGFLMTFNDGGCCGGGVLERPVVFQVHYFEAAVRIYGGREEDVVLAGYEPHRQEWVPLDQVAVDSERDVVSGLERSDIRRFVAAFAGPRTPVEPRTWGAVKALFRQR